MAEDLEKKAELQRESIRLEKEYQDSLKMSSSLSGQITSALNSQVDFRTQIGKKVKEHYRDLSSSIKQLETSEDIGKKIVEIEANNLKISKSYRGVNLEVGKQKMVANNLALEALKIAQAQQAAIEQVDEKATAFTNSLNEGIDSAFGMLKEIPVIGGLLSSLAQGPVDELKGAFANAGKQFVTDFSTNLKSGAGMMQSLGAAGGNAFSLIKAAINPVTLAILAIGAGIVMAIQRFNEVQEAARAFRDETGLLNSQTQGLQKNIEAVSRDMAGLGVSAADVSSAASTFSKQFGNTQQAGRGVLTSMVALEKSFGVSAESQATVNEQFQRMGGLSAEAAQGMMQTTVEAAKLAGVAPAQVMADIASNSEASYKYFNGSVKGLASAAIQAAKLGTSIGEAAKVSEGLLDFEDSITNELEASAMLGTNINFNKARALAADKDILGAQRAVVEEASKLGDLTKLSVFEQEALAKAAGMPIADLIKQQQIQEKFGGLDDERLAAANELIKAGKEVGDISDEALMQEAQRLGNQKEMQSLNENLSNSLAGLGAGFSDIFMPLVEFVYPIITTLIDMVSSILLPAFKIIGTLLKVTFGAVSAILNPIMAIGKAFIGAIMEPMSAVADAIAPIGEKFQELSAKIQPYLDPLINILTSIGKVIGGVIGGAVGFLVDALMGLFDVVGFVFGGIFGFINDYMITPIQAAIDLFSGAISSIGSFFGFGGETPTETDESGTKSDTSAIQTEKQVVVVTEDNRASNGGTQSDSSSLQAEKQLVDGGSINDGIVQDGKIITTNPEDTLIATKEPDNFLKTLLESSPLGMLASGIGGAASMLGMGGSAPAADNSQLVAKMDELIGAVRETKDVFLDGSKVTAGVSKVVNKVGSNSYAV